jgi:hemolysin III
MFADVAHPVDAYVARAEAFSFWSHALGAAASVALLVLLAVRADGALAVTSLVMYGATLVLLFSASALHHVVGTMGPRWHAVSRRLDHISIYLLIAGTYTPVCLLSIRGAWGWSIFGVVWGIALAGSLAKGFWLTMPRWLGVAIYLVMGWVVVVAIFPLVEAVPAAGVWLLFAGGVAYSGGAVIYARQRPDPWPDVVGFHGIWHIFVLIGAGIHALLIWRFVV